MTKNMEVQAIWAIRDARGLSYAEKAFLFVVASRGCMTAKWDTAAADMGMSKNTYYKTRDSLLGKGLLNKETRFNNTTVYTVSLETLLSLTGNGDESLEQPLSLTGNEFSPTGNEFSPTGETKVTIKGTMKETDSAVADAPAPTLQEDESKEEAVTESVETSSLPSEEAGIVQRMLAERAERKARLEAFLAEENEMTQEQQDRSCFTKDELEHYWDCIKKKHETHLEALASVERYRLVDAEW
jgi:DNA-binding MarR family transcriptional regulator